MLLVDVYYKIKYRIKCLWKLIYRLYKFIVYVDGRYHELLSYIFEEHDAGDPPIEEVRDLPPVDVVPRKEWDAREPTSDIDDLETPVTAVIFHHTRTEQCFTKEECCKVIREIQDRHMDNAQWSDIGYNFLIGGDGRVYEGRGWEKVGSHTDVWNEKSIGVAAIGNFSEEPPSEEMLLAIEQLVSTGLKGNKYLKFDYSALGHNQLESLSTSYTCKCPGDAFYDEVRYMPHWTGGELLIEAEEPDSDTYDSVDQTPFYFTGEDDTTEDYSKGYDWRIYGPWEVGKDE